MQGQAQSLIGLIYESLLDDGPLAFVADEIACHLRLSYFVAGWRDASGRIDTVASKDFSADLSSSYARVAHLDPWLARLESLTPLKGYATEDLFPAAELETTPFYRDFVCDKLGAEIVHGFAAPLDGGSCGVLGGLRPRSIGPVTPEELGLVDELAPHFHRLISVRRALAAQRTGGRSATEIYDRMAAPVLAVNRSGQLLYANAHAERMLTAGDCLRMVRDGGLSAPLQADSERLRAAIVEAHNGKADTIIIRRVASARPILAVILPSRTLTDCAHALIVINDSGAAPQASRLRVAFGLSAAETEVAISLAGGKTPDEIADERQVSRETLKAQLKSIYAKTSTSRQAELVSVVLALHRFEII